jgi:multidrug efflux pump subunit AcrB
LLPIIARSPEAERADVADLSNAQIYSPAARGFIPLQQVLVDFETVSENQIIRRRNRLPTLTVRCDAKGAPTSAVFETLRPKVEAIPLPPGYDLEWGGEYEDSGKAQKGLMAKMPVIAMLIVLTVIVLFNSIKKPLIIFLTVPLAIIGVTVGLLLTEQPFGFMALLGFLSLSGMLIKNSIVLIDEINVQLASGKDPFQAVVDSGVSGGFRCKSCKTCFYGCSNNCTGHDPPAGRCILCSNGRNYYGGPYIRNRIDFDCDTCLVYDCL